VLRRQRCRERSDPFTDTGDDYSAASASR